MGEMDLSLCLSVCLSMCVSACACASGRRPSRCTHTHTHTHTHTLQTCAGRLLIKQLCCVRARAFAVRPGELSARVPRSMHPCIYFIITQECDDILNFDMTEIELLGRAIAHTLERLATDPALRQHLQYPITPRGGQRRGERRLQGMGLLTSAGLSLPFRGPLFVF